MLAPALEGFTPTPELPQIEEAQTLLARLAESDEVKSAAAARERRLKLQTDYGLAVAWSKGFAAEETKAAFARAEELSAGTGNSDQRFTSLYGQWITSLVRGELDSAGCCRDLSVRSRERGTHAGNGGRAALFGFDLPLPGAFCGGANSPRGGAEDYMIRAATEKPIFASVLIPSKCDNLPRSGYWQLGDFRRARELSDEAIARAVEVSS